MTSEMTCWLCSSSSNEWAVVGIEWLVVGRRPEPGCDTGIAVGLRADGRRVHGRDVGQAPSGRLVGIVRLAGAKLLLLEELEPFHLGGVRLEDVRWARLQVTLVDARVGNPSGTIDGFVVDCARVPSPAGSCV